MESIKNLNLSPFKTGVIMGMLYGSYRGYKSFNKCKTITEKFATITHGQLNGMIVGGFIGSSYTISIPVIVVYSIISKSKLN